MSDVDKREYKRRKARDSLKESEGLTSRIIRCPECDHRIMLAFDDCKGHATLYCNKCHEYRTINFKYFRLFFSSSFFLSSFRIASFLALIELIYP